ncbi:MAG: MarC family transcriptional regulator [Rhizobiales bacterium 65-9]|nr:MarC family protein [Hyphomicrobiales bacterium]OJY37660.1 MAG: MarC family transcriptional regulator [Rhizobiales bacterium 65-9]
MYDYLSSAVVTLLVTLDPPALAPMFISVTRGMTPAERRQVAYRASLIAFLIMAFFAVAGQETLRLLGIGLPAFRIAGGLLLFTIAFEMVFDRRNARKSEMAETAITKDQIRNIAAFPLAIPLMAGPGAITAMLLLAGRAHDDPLLISLLLLVTALLIAVCLAVLLLADRVARVLGTTGNAVLTRLLGVILAALAVQFLIDGAKAAFGLA